MTVLPFLSASPMREAVQGTSARGLVAGISVQQEHEPLGTVEQIELILLAEIDVERL
jgi:hypothetical protein